MRILLGMIFKSWMWMQFVHRSKKRERTQSSHVPCVKVIAKVCSISSSTFSKWHDLLACIKWPWDCTDIPFQLYLFMICQAKLVDYSSILQQGDTRGLDGFPIYSKTPPKMFINYFVSKNSECKLRLIYLKR